MTTALNLILTLNILGQADLTTSPRAKAMREVARGFTFSAGDGRAKIEGVDDPIYRFNDPARDFSDGTVWAFGKSGRPAALFTMALMKDDGGKPIWLCEFTSLSGGPVRTTPVPGGDAPDWSPLSSGIVWKPITDAPAPAGDESKRLRQMRDIARRFKANEYFQPKGGVREERYELRTLAKPVHRYADPKAGLVDGAIFLIAYGQNPETVLLIEAREKAGLSWSYGLARISGAKVNVLLDDRQVEEFPAWPPNRPVDPYLLFTLAAPGLET